jgi:hypothetical protein
LLNGRSLVSAVDRLSAGIASSRVSAATLADDIDLLCAQVNRQRRSAVVVSIREPLGVHAIARLRQ